jgi:amino acid transporter
MENDGGILLGEGKGKLTTIDAIGQSMAAGPVFSTAIIGAFMYSFCPGASPATMILTTIGILGLGLVIAGFAKKYSGAGALYEYLAHSLGKRAGVMGAGAYWLAYTAFGVSIPIIAGCVTAPFCAAHLGFNPPWWACTLVITAIIAALNLIGVRISVKTQLSVLSLSLIPFAILCIVVIAKGGATGNTFAVFNPGHVEAGGSVFKGMLFAILMFVGFELSASLGEETAEPKKSIPRAVIATVLIVGVVYTVTQYVGSIGSGGPNKVPFDFGVMAQVYVGNWLSILINLGIIFDIIGIGIGFFSGCSRVGFALARDGMLPAPLAKVSKRRVPAVSLWVTIALTVLGTVITGLAFHWDNGMNSSIGLINAAWGYEVLSAMGTIIVALVYATLCIAGFFMFIKDKMWLTVLGAVLGFAVAVGAVTAQFLPGLAPSGTAAVGRTMGIIGVGVVIVWIIYHVVRNPDRVEAAGEHALKHEMTEVNL